MGLKALYLIVEVDAIVLVVNWSCRRCPVSGMEAWDEIETCCLRVDTDGG
jgi:hypothetical protein